MSTQKNNGPTKYANSNLNSVFAKSSTSSSASSTGPVVSKYNGMLVLSKQRLRPSSTAAGPKLAVPKPVNLPSMRKEHAGNDPTTVLVPTGGTSSGWNKPEDTSVPAVDSARGAGVASGATWAATRTQSPAWAPTPSEAAKAAQVQPHARVTSTGAERHLNPEEYPSLGATTRTQSQPLPRRSAFSDQQNQDHLWTDDERNVPSAAPYKQSTQDWSREADDDSYVPRQWDSGKGSPAFPFAPSRSFSTSELHDDYVPRRFDFEAPPPPPPARRPGAPVPSKDGARYASGFEFFHEDSALFPPPPPPPGRPHDGAASDKSEEEDPEREAFYETLDKVAAELQKRKEETEKEKEEEEPEHEVVAEPEPEPEAEPEPEVLSEEPSASIASIVGPPPPPPVAVLEVEEKTGKTERPSTDSPTTAEARSKLVIQPRKSQRELEYEEEERRRKAAAAEKLRQLEERMERQRREKEEAEAKARAEEEAAKKAAAAALQPPAGHTPAPAAAAGVSHSGAVATVPEPSGLSTPTEEEAEAWGEKGFKADEERPLVVEEEEEDAEPPIPAEPVAEELPVVQPTGNAWQRGPPIQPAPAAVSATTTSAVNMSARFGNFDDDLLEDISKAAKQQTSPPPAAGPARGKVPAGTGPAADVHPSSQRSAQSSWRSQPKPDDSGELDAAAGVFDRNGRRDSRGSRGGRGTRGGRTPDSGTPRSSRSSGQAIEAEMRGGRGKVPARNERNSQRVNDKGNERGPRSSGREDGGYLADEKSAELVVDAGNMGPAVPAANVSASVESALRPSSAASEQSSTESTEAKGKRNAGRMNKDALVPPPSSTSISKAPGSGRGRNDRAGMARANAPSSSGGLPADSAAQAAAAVAAAVAGVTSSNSSSNLQANHTPPTSLLTPAHLSPRAAPPGLPPAPHSNQQGRSLDSRNTHPTVDVKVMAPIGPVTQPSPQPIARSPVMATDPAGLWGPTNIVKEIGMSLGPQLTGSDPVHLGSNLPAAGKPVQLGGAPLQGFDRQIGPRQGGTGKDLGPPEPLSADVLGNGIKFPENLMDVMQPQHKQQTSQLPFQAPQSAANSMVRPLGPNTFPFHAPADSAPGSTGPVPTSNTLNLWGHTPLSFGQHPAGAMHHNTGQPNITATLESYYNPALFPTTSLPMHPPAAPSSPNPHHSNQALMSPNMLAGLHQYGQPFPNLYAPHTQFGTMGTTFGQFPPPAFIPTGKQPDWSTPNAIGIPSNTPVLNPGLVRPSGSMESMPPLSPYPLAGPPQQQSIQSDPHQAGQYQSGMNPALGAAQQQGLQPGGMQSLGGVPASASFSNMVPGSKQNAGSMPMKVGQGVGPGQGLMLGGHSAGVSQGGSHLGQGPNQLSQGGAQLCQGATQLSGQMQMHGKIDSGHAAGSLAKGVPQLPDDVFPGMEPSSAVTIGSMQNHATSNGQSDSQPSSKQGTPPGLAPPHVSQQIPHHHNPQQQQQHHHHAHHHHHTSSSSSLDRHLQQQDRVQQHHQQQPHQASAQHEQHAQRGAPTHGGTASTGNAAQMSSGSMKHGGGSSRGSRTMNSGSSGSRTERGGSGMGGRGSGGSRASRSPIRNSDGNGGSRNRGSSGSARGSGAGGDKSQVQVQPTAAVAAAAAAVAALGTPSASATNKDAVGSAAGSGGHGGGAGQAPSLSRSISDVGRSGGGRSSRNSGGRVASGGTRGRGPASGPKTMYVPKGTIPPNAQVRTEAG